MPLIHGYSRAAISQNISKEVKSGRDRRQAIAIAMEAARKAFQKANPGKNLPMHLRRVR